MTMLIKPPVLKKGDKVALVSLSKGILGESFCSHQLKLGIQRAKEFGLELIPMSNALNGIQDLEQHPEKRAADLKQAFKDPEIRGIICAIGGIDGFRLLPYLMEDEEFKCLVKQHPKIFIGFSDTTNHHLMLYKLGLQTFYGPAFLTDFAELDKEMLPYTRAAIDLLFGHGESYISSSPIRYEERTDFSESQLNIPRIKHPEQYGFELIQGAEEFSGRLLGGCIESLYEMLIGGRFLEQKQIFEKYTIFPSLEERKGKVLFIETSEELTPPAQYQKMLQLFKSRGIFDQINAIIVGKPQNQSYYQEYKQCLCKVVVDSKLPILYNLNFGHSYPRCILPYGALIRYQHPQQKIYFEEPLFQL